MVEMVILTEKLLHQISELTGFHNNGDVDYDKSFLQIDGDGNIISAIVLGNITNGPTLGRSIPADISDENGSAQVLLLYLAANAPIGCLNNLLLMGIHIGELQNKLLWCFQGEHVHVDALYALGFNRHICGLFYMSL